MSILYFTIGMYVCGFGAKALQTLLRQSRPIGSNKSSYGMPSAHSSTVTYIALYTLFSGASGQLANGIAFHCNSTHLGGFSLSDEAVSILTSTVVIVVCLVASSVCWSRYYLSHHTTLQICCGLLYGASISMIWIGFYHQTNRLFSTADLNPFRSRSFHQVLINYVYGSNKSSLDQIWEKFWLMDQINKINSTLQFRRSNLLSTK
ncbi:uncharacterized protein MELLADRAFT_96260 [Melampsora larici-populina 98AG31]|uniref:Phosphatidic acid phosphatase type 2/haloperoxidase domain-containing protein n=1 Tax=Melampsora larici-populina (strain 98AG31 / pathotype 3-4-7) TaxID=747676 RepID=F4RE47_MELLP|nr:uncharacterized protein MELLADRAFT_96260 [Melampsora larici-populina 98AG31]EGG09335.1 hypothetical protein MELLADRAFT_96260 [Melampsora larici-populina 98AG31]